jgi:hypothetical protein
MTLSDLIVDVRRLAQDQEELRYADSDILAAYNLALTEIQRLRPDIVALHDAPQVLASTDAMLVPRTVYMPLVAFVAGWLELGSHKAPMDDDTKAAALIQRLTASLVGAA